MTTQEAACAEQLKDLRDEIAAIEALFEDTRAINLVGKEKDEARERLGSLKDRLAPEHTRLSSVRGERTLTDIEQSFYQPAISEAHVRLQGIKRNSVPTKHWLSRLYDARASVEFYLSQLEIRL